MTNWQLIITLATLVFAIFGASWLNLQILKSYLDARFDTVLAEIRRLDQRIDHLNQRIDDLKQHINTLERQFEQRFNALERQFEQRFKALEQRFDRIENQLAAIFKPVISKTGD